MLKTRKLISLVLVVAMVLSMAVVGIVSASAAEGTYYLMGSMNSWTIDDAYAFTENGDNPGEYMLMGVTLSSSDTFKVKVDNGNKDTGWYPDGMGNDGTVDADGTYNIYFNPNGNPEWTANSGYCYLELVGDQDPTDPPADPTDPPADPTDPPADPTDAPADPTDAPADPTDAPVTGNDAKITIDGVSYDAHVGDKIHYDYYVNMNGVPTAEGGKPGKITEFEGSLYYDKSKLTLLNDIDGKEDEDTGAMLYENLPNIKSGNVVVANDDPSRLGYNGINLSGYNFSSEKVLLHADFEVKAAGESTITNVIDNLGSGEVKVVYLSEVKEQFGTKTTATVECPHGDQTEKPTQAPETQAPPVGDKAVVTIKDWSGTTETREFKIGDEFSVISYLQVPENKRVNSIDVRQQFNVGDAVVELVKQTVTKTDDDGEEYTEVVPALTPQIKDAVINVEEETSTIKANGSKAKYNGAYKFPNEDSVLMQSFYKVVANGNTNINTWIQTMATITSDDAMENQIMSGEKVGDDTLNTKTVFEGEPTPPETQAPETQAPETQAPETQAPETQAPETQAPETQATEPSPILGSSYYLTGTVADWGPKAGFEFTRTDNTEVEEYSISGIALTTDDMIKAIKTNKGGTAAQDWYPDGMDNNITVDHDSTYTILFRPNGDGTEEDGWIYSWKAGEPGYDVGGGTEHWGYLFKVIDEQSQPDTQAPETQAPETQAPETQAPETQAPETQAPETQVPTDAPHGLWVVADGKYYAVEPQQEITYIYYLNTGEKVCSLDAETFYDTDGLTLLTDTEKEMDQLFPIIKENMVLNDLVAGRLKYNYSAAKGKNFDNDDAQLICAKFRVDAEEGVYHIDTFLHTVAGADEHKYIFKDETLDELQRSEGLLDGIEPGPAPETEPVTQAPETQAPETQAPETQAPETQAPETQAPETQAPETQAPETQAPETQAPETQAPTTADETTADETTADETTADETTADETTADETTADVTTADETTADSTNAPAPASNGTSTADQSGSVVNGSAVQTGSTEMAIIFLVILVMAAGIVIYTKKRKVD